MARRGTRLVVLAGIPAVALVVAIAVAPWRAGWPALVLLVAGGVLEAFPVPLAPDVKSSLSSVATVLALLLGGASLALAVGVGAAIAVVLRLPPGQRVVRGAYNAAMFVVATVAAVGVFGLVAGAAHGPGSPIEVGTWIPATFLAMLAYYVVNLVLLSLALWVTGGPSPVVTLPGLITNGWWGQLLTVAFALAAYVVHVEAGPGALVLLLVPLASARRAMLGVQAQRDSLDRAVRALVRLVEVKDEYTRGHAERVAGLSDRVAARMGLSATQRYWIRIGAVLHDVGKIGVPLEVLTKPGELTEAEYWQMRRHPDVGADLLGRVDALAPAVPLVRQHHERIDGCGYPRGLQGDQVPLETRIVSAVDAWDAMTTTRPYRVGLPAHVALSELRAHSGTQFDPDVVAALVAEVAPLSAAPAVAPEPSAAVVTAVGRGVDPVGAGERSALGRARALPALPASVPTPVSQ